MNDLKFTIFYLILLLLANQINRKNENKYVYWRNMESE